MNNYYIYIYLDPRNDEKYHYNNFSFLFKPIYIGKGKNKRLKIFNNRNSFFKNTLNKIEKSGLKPIIIKLYENLSENQAFEIEKRLIQEIGRNDLNSGPLLNMTDGGEGCSGKIISKELKEIISKKQRKDFQYIKNEFEKRKYVLLAENNEYKNAHQKLKYICPKGHVGFISWDNFQKGRGCPHCKNSKLTEEQVIQIKLLLKEGILTQQEIADIFGISRCTISAIKNEKRWVYI
jgi:hypothetical protein